MPHRAAFEVVRNREFLCVSAELTVAAMAKKMKQSGEGAALVAENGLLVGICTERDITFRVVAEGLDPQKTLVREVMTHDPIAISPQVSFLNALHIMHEGGFRHVPVADLHGHPLGVISARDALSLEVTEFKQDLVRREELSELL